MPFFDTHDICYSQLHAIFGAFYSRFSFNVYASGTVAQRNIIWFAKLDYRYFWPFTRMANHPYRPIIAHGEKKSQQITCTGG